MHTTDTFQIGSIRVRREDIERLEQKLHLYLAKELVDAPELGIKTYGLYVTRTIDYIPARRVVINSDAHSKFETILNTEDENNLICSSIQLEFRSLFEDKRIFISFREGESFRSGVECRISSDSRTFVNSSTKELQEIFYSFPKIPDFHRKYPILVGSLIWIFAIFLSVIFELYLFNGNLRTIFEKYTTAKIILFVVGGSFGTIVGNLISKGIAIFCPNLEFDFGPDHLRQRTRAKRVFSFLILSILLPFFIGFIVNKLS